MGLSIHTGNADFTMSYRAFGELRRDLARLIGLKAALDGTVAWPKVDTSSIEQQPMLALVFLLNHRDSEGYLPSVRAAHTGTHAGDRPLGRRLRQARLA